MAENILTIRSIEHPLIPKIYAADNTWYEMEYVDGESVGNIINSVGYKERIELTFKLISEISSLISVMFKLKNESLPYHMFIGKDMRNYHNYMIDKDGRILCIDFDTWRWYPDKEAIWNARNAHSFIIEKLLIS
tara:strand:- start:12728 stop:13129 length:402 start_codon:yes stop_codon:yes gene_type:complete